MQDKFKASRKWLVWIVVAMLPMGFQLLIAPDPKFSVHNGPWTADLWVFVFSLLIVYGLWCPYRTWARFIDAAPSIAELLGSPENNQIITDWLQRYLRPIWQVWLPLLGSCIAIGVLASCQSVIHRNVAVDAGSYVAIAMVGFIAVSGYFWVMALTVLVSKIVRCGSLRLIWHDPIHSTGVNEISRLLVGVFVLSMGGAAVVSTAILRASVGQGSVPEHIFVYLLLAVGVVTLTFVGIAPQVWLSSTLHKTRRDTLRTFDRTFIGGRDQLNAGSMEEVARQLAFYATLSEASASTIRLELVAVYVGAILTGLAPFAVQAVLH